MLTEDNILTIGSSDFGHSWRMTLNLNVITEEAGKRVTDPAWTDPDTGIRYRGDTYTLLPLPQARKIINLILEYANMGELERIDEIFRKNAKLYKIWKEKYEKQYP